MKKLIIIIIVVIILLAGAGYFYWMKYYKKEEPAPATSTAGKIEDIKKAEEAGQILTESATSGTLPEINPQSNPLEKLPETNPIEQTNPFKNLKTNPFE